MKTALELIEYMKLPQEMVNISDILPNLKFILNLIERGKIDRAKELYDLYQSKHILFLTPSQIINRRTKKNNIKLRKKYGNNWSGNTPKKQIWRDILLKKQNKKCAICGELGNFEFDHIVRIADGGKHELENLQLVHLKCHDEKDNYKKGTIADGIHDVVQKTAMRR